MTASADNKTPYRSSLPEDGLAFIAPQDNTEALYRLPKNDQELRELMENIPVLSCAFRGEHFAFVNSALQSISGYSEQELLSMNWWEVISPDFQDLVRERGMARQRGEKVPTRYEATIHHKSGQEIWLDFFFSTMDIEGKQYVLVALYDITARKEAEKNLQEDQKQLDLRVQHYSTELNQVNQNLTILNQNLADIVMNMSDGVVIVSEDGHLSILNPVMENILKDTLLEVQEDLGQAIRDHKTKYITPMFANQQPFQDQEVLLNTSRGYIHCLASGTPINNDRNGLKRGVIIIRPIKEVHKLVNRFSGAHASFNFSDIITADEQMLSIIENARKAASSMANVLIEGESGTGKEMLAQSIHNDSPCYKGPFVAVNCGAIAHSLIGSELFGYAEGAFTGAKKGGNAGKFELASGGTLFLDEIGEMPLEQQVVLLRVLQEKTITRIGGHEAIPVNVRIVCASNKNLFEEMQKGHFRRDLYYRLNVFSLTPVPLRERRQDIALLFDHFIKELSRGRIISYDPGIISYLEKYDWPGNIRELQNVVERMVYMAGDLPLSREHLPPEINNIHCQNPVLDKPSLDAQLDHLQSKSKNKELLAELEREEIVRRLALNQGNVSQVAREMGFSRRTIHRKIIKYNIEN